MIRCEFPYLILELKKLNELYPYNFTGDNRLQFYNIVKGFSKEPEYIYLGFDLGLQKFLYSIHDVYESRNYRYMGEPEVSQTDVDEMILKDVANKYNL